MRGLKRKSEHQLARTVTFPCQDTKSDHPMATVYDLSSMLWNWCRSVIVSGALVASSNLVGTAESSFGQDKLILSSTNSHGISSKRQKINKHGATLSRSKSMTDLRSKNFSEIIDVSECSKDEARQKIEEYWEPKPMPWMRQDIVVDRQLTVPKLQSDLNKNLESQSVYRRSSDPPKMNDLLDLRTQSLSSSFRTFSSHRTDDVKASIDKLLAESTKQLAISDFKRAKNIIRAKEIKEKKRQDAINQARQRRLCRIYPKHNLVPYLDPYWEDRVTRAHTTWGEDVLTTSIGGTELRIKDFRTLLDRKAWLNDEIINSYIEWIVDAANRSAQEEAFSIGIKPSPVPSFIAHNSFFYENLRKKGPASLDRLMKRKGAPGKSLLEVDSVFVPICSGSHWTLGVVRPIAKTIEYFDSMGGSSSSFVSYMQDWLKHQLGDAYLPREWSLPKTACANQTNGYDCGVFVCTNAFCVAVGLDTFCYLESDMTRQRKNIAAVLLNRGFSGEFAWTVRENGLLY